MAAPSYTTDLSDLIADSDTAAWSELTTMIAGGNPDEADTESALQGTNSCSQSTNTTSLFSMCRILTSPVTLSSGYVFLVWHGHGVATALASYASGGLRLAVATDINNWKAWAVGGNDVPPFPYAKWVNNPIDPTLSADYTYGTPPTTNYYGVGSAGILTAAVAKGQPHIVDIIRYGRAEARMNGGESANYATFAGFAAVNDTSTNRWGLIQAVSGGYQWKGLMNLGYSSAVDFRDSNTMIMIQDCRKVSSGFNKIEIRQSGSRVDWTNIIFLSLSPSTNASKGSLEVIDDCDVNISYCTFTDMDTFIFKASSDILNSTFRRCNTITANDAKFAGTLFDASSVAADTSQLIWDVATNPSTDLTGCTFVKGANAHHAIEFGTSSPTEMTLTNMTFTGFNASNGQNDSALHIKRTTGTVTITLSGTSTPSYKSAGATVVFVTDTRRVKVIAQLGDGTKIENANVFLVTAADAVGGLPYDDTVTIVNSGTTATVTHSGHGMATGDKVRIRGASLDANNGVFTITKSDDNTYTYTMGSSPGSNPTGTIKADFVFLKGLSNSDGEVYMDRAIPASQLAVGWARKSSSAPYYKTGAVAGTVSSSGDTTFSAILISDS